MPAPNTPVFSPSHAFFWSIAGFFALIAWDYSPLDLAMAHWFGSAAGFPLEDHWFWRGVLHDDIRLLPWLFELGLLASVAWPVGTLARLSMFKRVQLALTPLVALLLVSNIKLHSSTSCPWGCGPLRVALGLEHAGRR